jgi:predicted N-acyltransferase
MQFDIQVAHSVDVIGQKAWDHLSGNQPFSSYRWYRYGEKVMGANLPIYIILSSQGKPVARGTFWLVHNELLPISKLARALFQPIIRRWPLMICRVPLMDMLGLIVPEPPLRDDAIATIVQIAREQAKKYKASFIIANGLEREESEWNGWPDDFIPFKFSSPLMGMNIVWSDFEDYLKHLHKSARKTYKQHCRFSNEQGLQTVRGELPMAGSPEFNRALKLIANVANRHHSPPSPWARGMLEHADMIGHTWVTVEKDGRMMGCGILLEDGDHRLFSLVGLDYSVKFAYFQLYYERIRCTIEQGARFLWCGRGNYFFKQHIGFNVMNREYIVWTAMNTRIQRLMTSLIRFLNVH